MIPSTTADITHVHHPELPGDTTLRATVNSNEPLTTADAQYPAKDPSLFRSIALGDRKKLRKAPVELAATDFNRRS